MNSSRTNNFLGMIGKMMLNGFPDIGNTLLCKYHQCRGTLRFAIKTLYFSETILQVIAPSIVKITI